MSRPALSPRFSAALLLIATSALFAAPLVSAWEHLSHEEAAAGHAECEAWTVASSHEADHDIQFEVSESARHEHHGLCQASWSLTGVPSEAWSSGRLAEAADASVESLALPRASGVAHPPSRGPPPGV